LSCLLVELADRLEGLFQFFVVVEPAAHLSHLFAAQAELAGATMGIADGWNENRMSFTASRNSHIWADGCQWCAQAANNCPS
jgi:hypothetical protein